MKLLVPLTAFALVISGCSTTDEYQAQTEPESGVNQPLTTPQAVASTPLQERESGTLNVNSSTTQSQQRRQEGSRTQTASRYRAAEDLVGEPVKNSQGETLGIIQDLVLDLESGNVSYIVLAMDQPDQSQKLIAVPARSILTQQAGDQLVMNTDKQQLLSAPGFDLKTLPNTAWGAPQQQVLPSDLKAPDGSEKAPLDRVEKPSDKPLAGRIRTALEESQEVGAHAKYVELVVDGGRVTLQGAVSTEEMKKSAEKVVRKVEGVKRVKNELEVKGH